MKLAAYEKRLDDYDVAFIHDDAGSVHDWKLRSLPALQFLGFGDFTYPTSWRQLKHTWEHEKGGRQVTFPEYGYHVLGGIEAPASSDFGVLTTSYYEENTQYTIRPLVDRYTTSEGTLVVVADEKQFHPYGAKRPLYQEPFVVDLGNYDRLYKALKEVYADAGWPFLLDDTKNVYLQDNGNLYQFVEGETVSSTLELFEVLEEAPYLPLYRAFGRVFDNPNVQGTGPLESKGTIAALGGWLRRRIEWDKSTSEDVARTLNSAVAAKVSTFDPSYAARSRKVKDAERLAKQLDTEANSIDAKYHDWILEAVR